MIFAASDSPQLYVPADNPFAWFTMPMLFWALALLAFAAAAAVGMCVALVRRLNRVEDDHDDRIASATLDAKKAIRVVARLNQDVDALFNAAHDHGDEPQPLPGDLATSPSLDVAGEAARRVLEETPADVGPPTQMSGQWREVNIGGEKRRFLIGP